MPPLDGVNSWAYDVKLSNELSNSSPPVDEYIVPPLCLDPPLCPQVNFESMTMSQYPWHGQPYHIGKIDSLWHDPTLVIHMVPPLIHELMYGNLLKTKIFRF